ncbi:MAG: hypothetical protein QOJ11_2966 [Frankiales bacterium]|nr:hypothetical protein [Frankiales bacterium]
MTGLASYEVVDPVPSMAGSPKVRDAFYRNMYRYKRVEKAWHGPAGAEPTFGLAFLVKRLPAGMSVEPLDAASTINRLPLHETMIIHRHTHTPTGATPVAEHSPLRLRLKETLADNLRTMKSRIIPQVSEQSPTAASTEDPIVISLGGSSVAVSPPDPNLPPPPSDDTADSTWRGRVVAHSNELLWVEMDGEPGRRVAFEPKDFAGPNFSAILSGDPFECAYSARPTEIGVVSLTTYSLLKAAPAGEKQTRLAEERAARILSRSNRHRQQSEA